MNKAEIAGLLSLIFLGSILFTPSNSDIWKYFLVVGAVFGAVWFMKK